MLETMLMLCSRPSVKHLASIFLPIRKQPLFETIWSAHIVQFIPLMLKTL